MWKNLAIVFLSGCILLSCGDRQSLETLSFSESVVIPAELISMESPVIGYPYDMFVSESSIYVLCFKDGKWIHSFDRTTGCENGSYVNRGRGPGECMMCTKLYFDADRNELYLFDRDQEKIVMYDMRQETITFLSEDSFADVASTVFYHVWPLSDNTYIANSQHGSIEDGLTRFQIYSDGGILLGENSEIPDLGGDDRYSYTQSSVSMSPDRKHLVSVTLMGEILDVYELTSDSMNKTVEKVFSAPNVVYQDGVVRESKETRWGFPFVSSDNNFIYASMTDDMDPNKYNKIAVFNWDGNGLIKVETDYNVLRLYPYEKDIYAVVADHNNQLFFARFNGAVPVR